MPLIPRLQPSEVRDAAAPVLDRERRPTVDTREVAQAAGNLGSVRQPTVNGAALAAPFDALGSIGRAVGEAGGILGALAIKQREAESDMQVADAQSLMETARAEFESWTMTDRNPGGWGVAWDEKWSEATAAILSNDKLNEGARQRIGLAIADYGGKAKVDVARTAARKSFAMAGDSYDARIERAFEVGNYDHALTLSREKVGKGYGWEHETAHLEGRVKEAQERDAREAKAALYTRHEENIIGMAQAGHLDLALKQLDAPGFGGGSLTNDDKQRLRDRAQAVTRDRQAEAAGAVADGIASEKIKSSADIDALDDTFLTPSQKLRAKEMLRGFNADKAHEDREKNGVRNFVEMRRKVSNYDPASDPDRAEFYMLLQETRLRVGNEDDGILRQELYRKSGAKPPEWKPSDPLKAAMTASIAGYYDRALMPFTDAVDTAKAALSQKDGGTEANRAALNAARLALSKKEESLKWQEEGIHRQMREWFEANPNPAPDKVRGELNRILDNGTAADFMDTLFGNDAGEHGDAGSLGDESPRGFVEAAELPDRLPPGLQPYAADFIEAAAETGMNPWFLAAVSMFETGDGTSNVFRTKNNAMGISDANGATEQASVRDSIFRQARTLARRNGPYAKAGTIDAIGAIYAPPGAGNDPKGTNAEWPAGVKLKLRQLLRRL